MIHFSFIMLDITYFTVLHLFFSDVIIFMKLEIKTPIQFWYVKSHCPMRYLWTKPWIIGTESAVYVLRDWQTEWGVSRVL